MEDAGCRWAAPEFDVKRIGGVAADSDVLIVVAGERFAVDCHVLKDGGHYLVRVAAGCREAEIQGATHCDVGGQVRVQEYPYVAIE